MEMIEQLKVKFSKLGFVEEIRKKFNTLSDNEQMLVMLAGGVVVIFVLYSLVWLSAEDYARKSVSAYDRARGNLNTFLEKEPVIRKSLKTSKVDPDSLTTIITKTTQAYGLEINKTTPKSNNALYLIFEEAVFDTIIQWMLAIQDKHGLTIRAVKMDKGKEAGIVTARVTVAP